MKKNMSAEYAVICLSIVLVLCPAGAQTSRNESTARYTGFSPTMATIIVVLIGALFFMTFFSIYIRRCSHTSGGGGRPIISTHRGAEGLNRAVIDSFPTFLYSSVKGLKVGKGALECAICLNEFDDNQTLRLIPKCDHVFHPQCIDEWLTSNVTCPVCRSNLVPAPLDNTHISISISISNPVSGNEGEDNNNNNNDAQESSIGDDDVKLKHISRFRSHSTGHSLIQLGENVERFTLRLPEDVRKQVMRRALLSRMAKSVVVLPTQGSSRRGYRTTTTTGEGSSKGRFYKKLESLEGAVKSDRWGFTKLPSFLTRAFSVKVVASQDDASTSSPKIDATRLATTHSPQPPV